MGLFDKAKGIFFEEEDIKAEVVETTPVKEEKPEPITVAHKSTPIQTKISSTPAPPQRLETAINNSEEQQKFTNFLLGVLDTANLAGNDYYEFRKALDNMGSMGLTEIQMYKSVFSTLSIQGCDYSTLKSSGDHYLTVLNSEKSGFETTLAQKRSEEIYGRKESIALYEQQNKDIETQIEELRQQMEQNREQIAQEMSEIEKAEINLREKENQFNRAYIDVTDQIKTDMRKIDQYLAPQPTT